MRQFRKSKPEEPVPSSDAPSAVPGSVWALGFVSMFMDISSELVHSLLPVFMTSVLGASMAVIGVIEGVAEAAAALTKVFSGAISDYCRKRKLLAVAGYGLSALAKPLFPLAKTIWWVLGARFADRIGKGIRVAPRDALVADIAPKHIRGAAYGLRQSLDSVGAFIGPLLAVILMIWLAGDISAVLWIAVVPGGIAVLILIAAVREPSGPKAAESQRELPRLTDVKCLPMRYWLVVTLGAIFTLARFSEAFLILRAQNVGLDLGFVPVVMIVMNIFYSVFAYPAGAASDRVSARTLLIFGLGILVAADIILAIAGAPLMVFMGAALWGIHMAFTQGLLLKLVADAAPSGIRGTAFGIFNLLSGGALLLASVIAGYLWSAFGAAATFTAGAVFSAIAAANLLFYRPDLPPSNDSAGCA